MSNGDIIALFIITVVDLLGLIYINKYHQSMVPTEPFQKVSFNIIFLQ